MDETIFSQHGLENILNPSKKKKKLQPEDQDQNSNDPLNRDIFTNYFQNWIKINTQEKEVKDETPEKNPSSENIHATQTNPESFPQIMDSAEFLGRIPSQQIFTYVIQMLNSLLGHSEFQDQLIQELLRRKDFCEKMRNILGKDSLNQSLKY